MTEKKNKDGVPRRVGQVWAESCGKHKTEIVHIAGSYIGVWVPEEMDHHTRGPFDDAFHTLLFDPIWRDMSQYVIVTDAQRATYKKPLTADLMHWSDDYNAWHCSTLQSGWVDGRTYRVPADFTAWEPADQKCEDCGSPVGVTPGLIDPVLCMECGLKREKPEYRLFKIEWTDDGPLIEVGVFRPFTVNVLTCPRIDGYRLGWGFTDEKEWSSEDDFYPAPFCSLDQFHYPSIRTYAIGYLESQQ